mmetsp:Transcript_150151/g.482618  ORF Transcript_150151/g.482618 Transcript_150151/m.482618 type:complete len:597 (-) Transcript_150151:9-1799(-)
MDLPQAALAELWCTLDWSTAAAGRACSRSLQRDVDSALLSRVAPEFGQQDVHMPASLLHPSLIPETFMQGVPLLEVTGHANALTSAPVLGLWRLAVSQRRASQEVLKEMSREAGISVPKAGVLHRFLQLPLTRSRQLRLVQEFMSMCLISQSVRSGRAQSAGMFRSLSVAHRNFFACVDLTKQATLVVGDIPTDDPSRFNPRRLCELWAHILDLAAEEVPALPGPRVDFEDAPMVQCGPYVQQGPRTEVVVAELEQSAFVAGVLLTCRALRDYISNLRVARLCKNRARSLFQSQDFARALAFYRLAQWHCPHGDSTLFSNAALCCLRLSRPHAAVEHALNALFVDESNAKAAHTVAKAEISLGYMGCNGWQEDAIDRLATSSKPLTELRKEHRGLPPPRHEALKAELGSDPRKVGVEPLLSRFPPVEPRLLLLLAEEEEREEGGRGGDSDLRRRLLSAALLQGDAEGALLPATEILSQQDRLRVLEVLAQAPLVTNMEAALALGRETDDSELAFLYLAIAAASQDPGVLESAGEELVEHILAQHCGRWKTGSPYGTWLMACGGQAEQIAKLMNESYHIEKEDDPINGLVTTFRPRP